MEAPRDDGQAAARRTELTTHEATDAELVARCRAGDDEAWRGLVERFGANWRVLLAHLSMFGFVYPGERHRVPNWVMETLIARLAAETRQPPLEDLRVCQGTLVSREQYLHDVQREGYAAYLDSFEGAH